MGPALGGRQLRRARQRRGLLPAGGRAANPNPDPNPDPSPNPNPDLDQVVARLPEKVPEQKLPDISIAYNFICLLHLANEKGLEITGQEDFADMHVSQPARA